MGWENTAIKVFTPITCSSSETALEIPHYSNPFLMYEDEHEIIMFETFAAFQI